MGDYLKACECPPNAAKRCRPGHIECHAALEAFVHPPCPGCAERDQRLAASEAGAAVMRAALEEVRPYVGGAWPALKAITGALKPDAGAALLARVERLETTLRSFQYDYEATSDRDHCIGCAQVRGAPCKETCRIRAALSGADAGRASAEVELRRELKAVYGIVRSIELMLGDEQSDCVEGKVKALAQRADTLAAQLAEAQRARENLAANYANEIDKREEAEKERDQWLENAREQQERADKAEAALAERTRELEEARKVIDHPAMSCALDGMMCAKCRITFRDATIERVREALMKAIELAPYGDIERGVSELIQALDAERAKVRELERKVRDVDALVDDYVRNETDLRAKLAAAEQRVLERGTLLTELVDGSVWAREDIREYVAKMRAI